MIYLDIDVTQRKNFKKGMLVDITEKENLIRGYISKILSNENQTNGIKVQLSNGHSGRIYGVPSKADIEKEDFKFYNLFFNSCEIHTILKENSVLLGDANGKKCAYLFSSKEKAKQAVKGTCLEQKPYQIGKLNRKKLITDLLGKYKIDLFIIDMERQLTNDDLKEKEIHFRNL